MKPTIALLLILLAGCSLPQTQAPKPPAGLSTVDFTTRLFDKVVDADKNLIFSPFSIQVALAMCAAGAKGETRDVLTDLIGAPCNVDEQNRQYADLIKSVNCKDVRPFELVTANALWGRNGCRFKHGYKKTIADFYAGHFEEVDFLGQPTETIKRINAWASDRTHAKVKELVTLQDIKEDIRLILTNAIYFKGEWKNRFKQADTKDEEWHSPDHTSKVPMMHQTNGFLYYEDSHVQAVDLDYMDGAVDRGILSMLVVLPKKTDDDLATSPVVFGDRTPSMDGVASIAGVPAPICRVMTHLLKLRFAGQPDVTELTGLTGLEQVAVSLPRFKIETTFRLKSMLDSLGAGLAFSDAADFSGIVEEPLKISEVIHKAVVEVNEAGTEAAAATAAAMAVAAARMPGPPPEPKIFKANHPFWFFIRDLTTNTVLFAGRVVDPK
jgi:serpin B